jgi:hypothetical protein
MKGCTQAFVSHELLLLLYASALDHAQHTRSDPLYCFVPPYCTVFTCIVDPLLLPCVHAVLFHSDSCNSKKMARQSHSVPSVACTLAASCQGVHLYVV